MHEEDWTPGGSAPYTDGPLYAGYFFDAESRLYNVRNRYYDPSLSNFISRDPIAYDAGDPNLYRYVANGPLGATDAMGLQDPRREIERLTGIYLTLAGSSDAGDRELAIQVRNEIERWQQLLPGERPGTQSNMQEGARRSDGPNSVFPAWDEAVDEELAIVKNLNDTFGTRHVRLDAFTPAERARIEFALGEQLNWEGGAIRAAQGALQTRDGVLFGSEIALYGSAAAATTATGVALYQAAGASTFAVGTSDGHWFYGVTRAGTTTWAHWLPGHGVTQAGASIYGSHAGYWTTLEGVPIFFPEAALGTAGGSNCFTTCWWAYWAGLTGL